MFGPGKLAVLGAEARGLEGNRALIVSDPGLARTGFVDRACEALASQGVAASVYAEVHETPTTDDVDRCVAFAAAERIDLIVGLGGGSSLDTAKGCNFILTNGGRMQDYWGVGKATKPMLPFIAIPTTSGTGSECQSFALIADASGKALPNLKAVARTRGAQPTMLDLEVLRIEPSARPKSDLTGNNTERVDTRVIDVVLRVTSPATTPIFPGQAVDVFIGKADTQ